MSDHQYTITGHVANVSLPNPIAGGGQYYGIAIRMKPLVYQEVYVIDDDPGAWLKYDQLVTVKATMKRVNGLWRMVTTREDVK